MKWRLSVNLPSKIRSAIATHSSSVASGFAWSNASQNSKCLLKEVFTPESSCSSMKSGERSISDIFREVIALTLDDVQKVDLLEDPTTCWVSADAISARVSDTWAVQPYEDYTGRLPDGIYRGRASFPNMFHYFHAFVFGDLIYFVGTMSLDPTFYVVKHRASTVKRLLADGDEKAMRQLFFGYDKTDAFPFGQLLSLEFARLA